MPIAPSHLRRAVILVVGLCVATVFACVAQDGLSGSYFKGQVEPCAVTSDVPDPCAVGRTVQYEGWVPRSVSYPDDPPTLEAMLFNSWDGGSLDAVPGFALLSTTHVVARGRFVDDSLVCKGYPVVYPDWSLDHAGLGVPEPSEGQKVIINLGFDHWMCFAELSVQEYLVGTGASSLDVHLAAAAVVYESGTDFEGKHGQTTLDRYRKSIGDHFYGSDWVVWLGPSYTIALEAWTAYQLWDVQKGGDGIVRVVSPVAAHYEQTGLTGIAMERLRAQLTDFRRDIKGAHATRIGRTSGRIGVDTNTPSLVQDALRLSDYYEEVGAYEYPSEFQPKPAPTAE